MSKKGTVYLINAKGTNRYLPTSESHHSPPTIPDEESLHVSYALIPDKQTNFVDFKREIPDLAKSLAENLKNTLIIPHSAPWGVT
ncbi:hypothetical protein [Nostoc sp. CHAB 5715]|uniref:hypothetical protein n=1 Tax=Nostoc sp. CHAB 5715 TaxID=2780400 RepID=UPI001E5C3448|nr:hypothetical protein [Nostoc sp. CHAB 5715]MCC5623548.1 hypothetical protein [Nostoc sp. CHAB 5715]